MKRSSQSYQNHTTRLSLLILHEASQHMRSRTELRRGDVEAALTELQARCLDKPVIREVISAAFDDLHSKDSQTVRVVTALAELSRRYAGPTLYERVVKAFVAGGRHELELLSAWWPEDIGLESDICAVDENSDDIVVPDSRFLRVPTFEEDSAADMESMLNSPEFNETPGIDLLDFRRAVEYRRFVGVDKIVRDVAAQLGQGRSVVITAPPGAGKTSVVLSLALQHSLGLLPALGDRLLRHLSLRDMMGEHVGYVGGLEQNVEALLAHLRDLVVRTVVFFDEIHLMVGAGSGNAGPGKSSADLANLLKQNLSTGELQVLGASTSLEWSRVEISDPAFARRFIKISLPLPTGAMLREQFQASKPAFETASGFRSFFEEGAVEKILEIAEESSKQTGQASAAPDRFWRIASLCLSQEAKGKVENAFDHEPVAINAEKVLEVCFPEFTFEIPALHLARGSIARAISLYCGESAGERVQRFVAVENGRRTGGPLLLLHLKHSNSNGQIVNFARDLGAALFGGQHPHCVTLDAAWMPKESMIEALAGLPARSVCILLRSRSEKDLLETLFGGLVHYGASIPGPEKKESDALRSCVFLFCDEEEDEPGHLFDDDLARHIPTVIFQAKGMRGNIRKDLSALAVDIKNAHPKYRLHVPAAGDRLWKVIEPLIRREGMDSLRSEIMRTLSDRRECSVADGPPSTLHLVPRGFDNKKVGFRILPSRKDASRC